MRWILFFLLSLLTATTVYAAAPVQDAKPPKTTQHASIQTLQGVYLRSLQQSELIANGVSYHLYDPERVLEALLNSQDGYYKKVSLCAKGHVSAKGQYGHMGAYPYQFTVESLCQ